MLLRIAAMVFYSSLALVAVWVAKPPGFTGPATPMGPAHSIDEIKGMLSSPTLHGPMAQ